MKGIETAFFGGIGSDVIEVKIAKSGNAWTAFSVGVTVGTTDDGKDVLQWVRVSAFGETAERIAVTCKKTDRVYCEGSLKLDNWTDKHGEQRHGLSVSAFKVERVGTSNLGRNRPKRTDVEGNSRGPRPADGVPSLGSGGIYEPHCREPNRVVGRDDFQDAMPF
jgi:single-strand DNA-binding protein